MNTGGMSVFQLCIMWMYSQDLAYQSCLVTRLQLQVAETNPPGVFAANVKGSRATPSVAHAKQTLRSTRKTICWSEPRGSILGETTELFATVLWHDILMIAFGTQRQTAWTGWFWAFQKMSMMLIMLYTSTHNLNSKQLMQPRLA